MAAFEFGEEAHQVYLDKAGLTEEANEAAWMESFRTSHQECLTSILEYSRDCTPSLLKDSESSPSRCLRDATEQHPESRNDQIEIRVRALRKRCEDDIAKVCAESEKRPSDVTLLSVDPPPLLFHKLDQMSFILTKLDERMSKIELNLSASSSSGNTDSQFDNESILNIETKKVATSRAEDWLFNEDWESPTLVAAGRSAFRLPKMDFEPFNGDPKSWPFFKSNFHDLVHRDPMSNTQRLAILRQYLTPNIRESLGETLHNPSLYREALQDLHMMYGHPHIVSRPYIRSLIELPSVKENHSESLRSFVTKLRGGVASLKYGGYETAIDAGTLELIIDKLPSRLKNKWGKVIVERYPNCLTIYDFTEWILKLTKHQMMVDTGSVNPKSNFSADRQEKKKSMTRPNRTNHASGFATTDRTDTGPKCLLCSGNHFLINCNDFNAKVPEERALAVRENRCCFRCLIPGHKGSDCRNPTACKIDGCKYRHHPLLHGAPPMFPKSRSTEAVPTAFNGILCATVKPALDDKTVFLCVVPIKIRANNRTIETFALLDTGSEVSLIRTDVARSLGLRGSPFTMKGGTFHGSDSCMEVERVDFVVSPVSGSPQFMVKNALSVPLLNVSNRRSNWPELKKRWPHLSELDIKATN